MRRHLYLFRIRAEILARKVLGFVLRYGLNLLISLDCLANAILCGHPNETISERLGRKLIRNPNHLTARIVCFTLGLFDRNHCRKAAGCKKENPSK